ncbi:MAG TPA: DUF92 domain-containing protein [Chloroflexia bacterium]|nr:DUF92 domain-containing protein [Chloroflexia bacterium]
MTEHDITGLIASYIYAFSLLGLATAVQKWRGYSPDFTRKIVHVGAGMWIFGLFALFDTWYWGVFPIATFIIFNFISYRFTLVKAMDQGNETPGTVYFVVSITLLLTCFWPRNQFWIAAAGIMAMTWGDAFASVIGRKFGRHFFYIGKHRRSLEGSTAMFGFSFVAIAASIIGLRFADQSYRGLPFYLESLALALLMAALATFLEAISLYGLDNVFVPIGTTMALFALISWNAPLGRLVAGLALSALIGLLAYRRQSLTLSGVMGAIITGTLIFGLGGWVMGLTLIAFFVYGTVLSKYKERQKNVVAADKFEKGSRRDMGQALANGGLGAVLAVLYFLYPASGWLFAAYIGAMATVNADTWATELGVLSPHTPRLITSGKKVVPGTSGGITLLGTSATALGGLIIGLTVFGLVGGRTVLNNTINWGGFWWLLPVGLVSGLAGSLSDSFMGATVQAMYYNEQAGKETEKKVNRHGQKNTFLRGLSFMDNDAVNFISSGFGAAMAALLYLWLV